MIEFFQVSEAPETEPEPEAEPVVEVFTVIIVNRLTH